MIRLLLSLTACFFAAASFAADLPLTGWAQLDSRGALRIVNRLDYVADNFSGKATGRRTIRSWLTSWTSPGIPLFIPL